MNVVESSTWISYDVAPVTSDQSNATGCAGVAPLAGDSSVGAAGVGGGAAAAFTVSDVLALNRSSAVIVTAVSALTDAVAIAKVADVAPAGTVTLAGTLAAPFELNNWTTAPPDGAAPWSVAVPVDGDPPFTVAGETVTLTSGGVAAAGGLTVNPTLAALAPYAAVSDTGVVAAIALLVTNANDAVVDPVKTVTFAGSDASSSGWFVETVTSSGAGAAAPSATVATPPSPPRSVVTFAPSDDTVTPLTAPTVSTPLSAVESKYAVNVTFREDGTPRVKMRNAWLVEPATT